MAERTIAPMVIGPAGSTGLLGLMKTSEWQTLSSADNAHIDLDDTSTAIRGEDVIVLLHVSSGTTAPGIKILTSTKSPYTGSGQADQTFTFSADVSLSTIGSSGSVIKGTVVVLGPFETARYKDTDGYLNFVRSTGDTAAADYKVHAIVIKRK
jgi:hypothetical protein